jgi:hypothetical protein
MSVNRTVDNISNLFFIKICRSFLLYVLGLIIFFSGVFILVAYYIFCSFLLLLELIQTDSCILKSDCDDIDFPLTHLVIASSFTLIRDNRSSIA